MRDDRELTPEQLAAFGAELDALRQRTLADLGADDARYIRRVRAAVRVCCWSGRALLMFGWLPPTWLLGSLLLGLGKILENMELGHNVMHGQYDWMNDPEFAGRAYEWDIAGPSDFWRHTHNHIHHTYTNVLGKDDDVGYGVVRLFPEQRWKPFYRWQPLWVTLQALLFQYAVAIDIGAPILYRQVRVGSVQSYQLSRDRQRVVVGVHIEPEYAHLVNTSTRFWNSSGITLTGNLSGVQVKSESLQTLITGGISFDTRDPKAPTVTKVRRFTLFDSEEAAMARGVEIQLSIDNADGLREGTPIRFKGLDIGKIESVELNPDLSGVQMKARLTSAGERVARSGTRFWVVRPALGLLRTENLGTLVSGPYIEALPSSTPGERQARFQTLAEAPNLLGRENGLRLTLSAPRKGSIKPGNLVTYRQIPVGKVVDLALGEQADRVLISILIEPRYVPLVRTGSRFWNASGFGVDASLFKGLSLRTESMEALMEGGIAFATPNNAQMGEPAKPGQTFALFDSANDEWLEWAPKIPLKETARR